ncbi:hypothetical protein SAMN05421504_11172 [Amycolatopsis xylanica]|uniref:Histone deacetylase n=1 Tax=Amycolatopsis xylanica TaxID=589385 RepID=A0A1H3RIG5_9PSEU|nr:histone deacetylase [Amycolatopsis xylanica]SDZ24729.1 hypothetical protein SAMN05421504_11172 [Amycolatopsis xylanica]
MSQASPRLVWYASYGSNMHVERFRCYLEGGVPPGAGRRYPGCRDRGMFLEVAGREFPGGVYFATESPVWHGGRAFYDPAMDGMAAMRCYLVTLGQFSDVAAQEMYREPSQDLDVSVALATGRDRLGPGRYETLLHIGDLDGHPVLTFTAPWSARDVELNPPSAPYLRMLIAGLREAQNWSSREIAEYLAPLPGVSGFWSDEELISLAADGESAARASAVPASASSRPRQRTGPAHPA